MRGLRATVPDLPDLAVADHGNVPLFRAVGNVALKAGETHVQSGGASVVPASARKASGTGFAPDKSLRRTLAQFAGPRPDAGETFPLRIEHDAALLQFGNGRGLGARAIDAQRRHVRRERREGEPGGEARESKPRQRALQPGSVRAE